MLSPFEWSVSFRMVVSQLHSTRHLQTMSLCLFAKLILPDHCMTSNEVKHQAKMQEWGLAIQDCRSSGLSVREWCRQRGVTPTTYYRWEREVLSGIRRKDGVERSGTAFVELPAPQPLRNVSECTATLNIGSGSIDLYQEINPELLRTLVELLRTC